MNDTQRPSEAELIERLRLARSPKLSVTAAAKRAGLSEGRWRQIAKGFQQATKDTRLPVVAPAETLARMAEVVGASVEQLREVGRDDAADELERAKAEGRERAAEDDAPVNPQVRGGAEGLRGAMRRRRIRDKAEDERTEEESDWLAAYEEAHPRRLDPTIFPTGEYRTFEVIFDDWQAARNRMLNLTLEYAATRKIPFQVAEQELIEVLNMATDVQSGRPWTPPWNPGAEFLPGDEPWKREWWASSEVVDAGHLGPEFAGHKINRVSISTGWDPERVRAYHAAQEDEWAPDDASPDPSLDMTQGGALADTHSDDAPPLVGAQQDYDLVRRTGDSVGQALRDRQDKDAESE